MNKVWISELEIIRVLKHNPTTISYFIRKLGLSIVLNLDYLCIYAFVAALGLHLLCAGFFLTVMSGGHSLLQHAAFFTAVFLLLQSTDSGTQVSAKVLQAQ